MACRPKKRGPLVEASTDVDGLSAAPAGYQEYATFKQWDDTLFEPAGADYFEVELRGFPLAGARVVEIGFGPGHCLAWLAAQGARVTGLEIQEQLVLAGRSRGFDTQLSRDFDWRPLQGKVDLILGFDVLEHLSDAEIVSLLRKGAAALRPGGAMLFRFPNMASPFGLQYQIADPTHVTMLSGPRIRFLLAGQAIPGLAYEGCREQAMPRPRGLRGQARRAMGASLRSLVRFIVRNSYMRGEPIPLTMNTVVVLRKTA